MFPGYFSDESDDYFLGHTLNRIWNMLYAQLKLAFSYGNPDADFVGCIVALEDAGVKTVGVTNECTGRDGKSQPLVTLDEKCDAIVSCGNVSELIELPPMETVLGELEALARDGMSGGWAGDEILGPSVREDGSIILENNSMFCGDQVLGWSPKTMKEF